MKIWRHLSPKQRIVGLIILATALIFPLVLWSRANFFALEDTNVLEIQRYALNFTVKEQVGNKILPAQGFIIIKPGCQSPSQPGTIKLNLASGKAYCLILASDTGAASIDFASFTSTRQNKSYRLPLSGERSLSKFWISESLDIEATVNSDGTVSLVTKPTRVF